MVFILLFLVAVGVTNELKIETIGGDLFVGVIFSINVIPFGYPLNKRSL